MAYKPLLDRFDMERGDALTLTTDTATELAELPLEIAGPILHALLKWFSGGELATLPDPRDNAMLKRLAVHQRQNAERRADILNTKRQNRQRAASRSRAHNHTKDSGEDPDESDEVDARQRPSTPVDKRDKISIVKSKTSVSDKVLDKDEVLEAACADAASAGVAACATSAAGVSACAPPADLCARLLDLSFLDSVRERIKEAESAKDFLDCSWSSDQLIKKRRFDADPFSTMAKAILRYGFGAWHEGQLAGDESEPKYYASRKALKARYMADPKRFASICWNYLEEANEAAQEVVSHLYPEGTRNCLCNQCQLDNCKDCKFDRQSKIESYMRDFGGCENGAFVKNLLGRLSVLKQN